MTETVYLDINRCSGCQACVVACLDQNDLLDRKRHDFWRQVFKVEKGTFPEVKISFLSIACMHCQETPCVLGCPTGAIYKDDETGVIRVRQEFCLGCHSCSLACPFGVPRFDNQGKMEKCQMCVERIDSGLEPACVHTCPTKALKFGEINELSQEIEVKVSAKILSAMSKAG
ncbi:MAG: 4Fe-4S dicluster domain-containing protein [Spirochaetales bacterium]|nr:4Fe-4S dicluster domain-containing protein [Spirochaetales bacterium]